MIIVSIYGGLGNQLFQYACAKAVAIKLGVELKLDISLVNDRTESENFTFRDYELGAFNVEDKIATLNEVRQYIPNMYNSSDLSKKLFKIKRIITRKTFYYEKTKFQFEDRINLIHNNTLIFGYFQTEKYFKSIRHELIDLFSLKEVIDNENALILNQIKNRNAVSIHVRRGDYLKLSFQELDIQNYYSKAIEIIRKKVKDPVFYIFSDDQLWVEENFKQFDIEKVFVKNNIDKKSFMDLFLMSQCKHNICANSTFSWWGAWLNTYPDKIIIAPKKWFKEGEFEKRTYDLMPPDWLQV